MTKRKTPAVLYLRMSSGKQEKSIPLQRAELVAYAEKHGFRIIREYIDEAISGDDTSRRTAFLQMREDAASGEFKAILCWDQDRFGRFDPIEGGYWIKPIRDAGVRLETIAQGRIGWDDFQSRMMFVIQQETKHQFLRDLARNCLRGNIARAKSGKWPGGTAPYGYEIGPDGYLIIGDPQKAAIVRDIFAYRLKGWGYRSIARKLNERGIPSPAENKWSYDSIRMLLDREAYCGTILFGGRRQGKYYTTSNNEITPVRNGSKQKTIPTRVENAHPAIIDRKTWETAQAIAKRKPKPYMRNGNEGAPLSGLLQCGQCGAPMYSVNLKRNNGKSHPRYVCSTYHKGMGCGCCAVSQDALLSVVANSIRKHVLGDSLQELEEEIARQIEQKKQRTNPEANARHREKKLAELDRQIKQATDRIVKVDESLIPMIENKLLELTEQRDRIQSEAKNQKPQKELDPQKVAAEAWRLGEVFEKAPASEVRNFLSQAVKSIKLDFKPGKKTGRGQSYDFVKGTIRLRSKQWGTPATSR